MMSETVLTRSTAEMYGIAYEPQAVGIGFDILDANGQYVYGTEIYDIVTYYTFSLYISYDGTAMLAEADNRTVYTTFPMPYVWYDDYMGEYYMEMYPDNAANNSYGNYYGQINVYANYNYPEIDVYREQAGTIEKLYPYRYTAIVAASAGAMLFLLSLVYLVSAAGHKRFKDTPRKRLVDKIPLEIHTAVVAGMVSVLILVFAERLYFQRNVTNIALTAAMGIVTYLFVIGYIMSMATRIKTGSFRENFMFYRLVRWICRKLRKPFRFIGYSFKNVPLIWKGAVILLLLVIYELIMINSWYGPYRLTMWIVRTIAVIPAVMVCLIGIKKLGQGGEEISKGNFDYQVDTRFMFGEIKEIGQDMNSIGENMSKAVDERMKSERFKTELITNVSHDIKTPLTSIINYVDLVKKEKPENENMRRYIDVLDRQSSRLKKLIEDLVEASKASTGNMPVNLEPCCLTVFLAQLEGEYKEKLESKELEMIVTVPEEPVTVMADSRHMWRVLDNLMNNVCKYAMPGTRVYVNLEKKDGQAVMIFRNISRCKLSMSSDMLLERFTRGDSSRNTEGSGLGLAIANSLTELQGGKLSLTVDGDLFKVQLSFNTVKNVAVFEEEV